MNERSTFVDIGAAEGYYAVGFLYFASKWRTIAYEANPAARESLLELAHQNGVSDRLVIRGFASEAELLDLLESDRSILFMMVDVEGAERDILTSRVAEKLRAVELIVEAHEAKVPGIVSVLRDRFATTHDICQIDNVSAADTVSEFRSQKMLKWIPAFALRWLTEERRGTGSTPWLHLIPRDKIPRQ